MIAIFTVLGLLLFGGGAYAIYDGWPYLVLERGFTEVIIGSIASSAGLIMLSLAWVLKEGRATRRALLEAIEQRAQVPLPAAAPVAAAASLAVEAPVVVPAVRPAMAVLAMLTFLTAWNDFFWPIITLSSQNPTIQVAFQSLATGYAPQQSVIMAGTLYGTIPVLVVFALLGRQIVGGIMQGAVKG